MFGYNRYMSIGPEKREHSTISTVKNVSAAIFSNVSSNAMRYIFYVMVAATAIKLFLNQEISAQYWLFLFFLGIISFFPVAYDEFNKNRKNL